LGEKEENMTAEENAHEISKALSKQPDQNKTRQDNKERGMVPAKEVSCDTSDKLSKNEKTSFQSEIIKELDNFTAGLRKRQSNIKDDMDVLQKKYEHLENQRAILGVKIETLIEFKQKL
jgi:uncharacterized coiled-coil protein SlyX